MLTEREKQVLALIGKGKRDREIADALGISAGTVQGYVGKIKLRLRIQSRVALALYWQENQPATTA